MFITALLGDVPTQRDKEDNMEQYQDLEGYPLRYGYPLESYKMVIMDFKDTIIETGGTHPVYDGEVSPPIMSNEYFTPSIEDIRVGYECRMINTYFLRNEWENQSHWTELKPLSREQVGSIIKHTKNAFVVRVPYLTKEQIEEEGWEEFGESGEYIKGTTIMRWSTITAGSKLINTHLHIMEHLTDLDADHTKYSGPCKDINSFRYICKLLGI